MSKCVRLFSSILALTFMASGAAPGRAQEAPPKVYLLGTGAPIPRIDRFGPATLVVAGGKRLLFDAGRGVSQRLWQLGFSLGSIDALFLTHLHSDHLVGLPDLWLTGWLQPEYGRRQKPLRLYGPAGVKALSAALREGFGADVAYRAEKEGLPLAGIAFDTHEIEGERLVFDEGGVKVSAFKVDHGVVKPAYGFRIDVAGKVIVLSGDTRYSENLIRHAQGADVLVHEVVSAPEALRKNEFIQRQFGYHTAPEDLARVLAAVKPNMAALNHFVLLGNITYPAPSAEDVVKDIRAAGYDGPLTAGVDLMQIELGAAINIIAAPAKSP
jgi:ribonuclease Z